MNVTTIYRRDTVRGVETLKVMAYLGESPDDGDEIRVMRLLADAVEEDTMPFFGPGGRQWLSDHDATWRADGYERVSSAPDA